MSLIYFYIKSFLHPEILLTNTFDETRRAHGDSIFIIIILTGK